MKKLADFLVDKKYVIFAVFIALLVLSVVAVFFVNVNSDIMSYLPEGLEMSDGITFMQKNFNMQSEVIVGVDDVTYDEMSQIMEKISGMKGLKDGGAVWIGTIEAMTSADAMSSFDLSSLDANQVSTLVDAIRSIDGVKNFSIFNMTITMDNGDVLNLMDMAPELAYEMLENQSLLSIFYPNYTVDEQGNETIVFDKTVKAKYLCMLMLDVPSSSDEALSLLRTVDGDILAEYDHAIGGDAEIVRQIFDSTINEMYKYILVAVLVMFIILILTTTSFMEPIVFMLTIGISIIINMGTNIVFGSVSIVTFACSAVLQLGLSMDYSIFLMHAFAEEKQKTLDENLAMKRAIPRTFSTVTASALTTVGGFLALFAMRFGIGADLGKVLAKGVFLSLLTVVMLQPCLMLMTSKWSNKMAHKIYLPKFKGVGKFSISNRKILVIIAIVLLIPSAVLQTLQGNNLSYIKFVDTPEYSEGSIQETVSLLSNSIITMVPTDSEEANEQFLEDLSEIDGVSNYLNIYTMIPDEYKPLLFGLLNNKDVMGIMSSMPGMSMMTGFVNNGYTLTEVMINAESETEREEIILGKVKASLDKNFGENTDDKRSYYITGMSQGVQDLRSITPKDNLMVSGISILIILIILVITQKSIKMPIILIGLIEFGIFINLSLCYIMGEDINFMCYIILSSIQLGSTVDYAILYTDKYQSNLQFMPANEAAYKALRDSAVSIITSVAIMAGCCLSVTTVATNTIVKQITWLIARGSMISGVLTIVVLPALLVVFTGNKKLKKSGRHAARILSIKEKEDESSTHSEAPVQTEQ